MPENAGTSLNSLTGSDLWVRQKEGLPAAHQLPELSTYVTTRWREQRWREQEGGYFVSSLVLFVGLNGPGNT